MTDAELRAVAKSKLKVLSFLRSDPPAILSGTIPAASVGCSLCGRLIAGDESARGFGETMPTFWYHGKCHEVLQDCRHEGGWA